MAVFRLQEESRTARTRCADGTYYRGLTVEAQNLTAGREWLYLGCRKKVEQREQDVPMVHISVASL
jgi:hypothetical protein